MFLRLELLTQVQLAQLLLQFMPLLPFVILPLLLPLLLLESPRKASHGDLMICSEAC